MDRLPTIAQRFNAGFGRVNDRKAPDGATETILSSLMGLNPRRRVYPALESWAIHCQHLRFAWQRLANEIANEAADDDVLTQLRNLGIE